MRLSAMALLYVTTGHDVTLRHMPMAIRSRVSLNLIDYIRKAPVTLGKSRGLSAGNSRPGVPPLDKKGGCAMKGTRTRTRTHTTPPLKRRERVAPVGYPCTSDFRPTDLCWSRSAGMKHSGFRAGGQRGQFTVRRAGSP